MYIVTLSTVSPLTHSRPCPHRAPCCRAPRVLIPRWCHTRLGTGEPPSTWQVLCIVPGTLWPQLAGGHAIRASAAGEGRQAVRRIGQPILARQVAVHSPKAFGGRTEEDALSGTSVCRQQRRAQHVTCSGWQPLRATAKKADASGAS